MTRVAWAHGRISATTVRRRSELGRWTKNLGALWLVSKQTPVAGREKSRREQFRCR